MPCPLQGISSAQPKFCAAAHEKNVFYSAMQKLVDVPAVEAIPAVAYVFERFTPKHLILCIYVCYRSKDPYTV
jgi:hypothetical protein